MNVGLVGKMFINLVEKHGIEKTLLVSAITAGGALIGGVSGCLFSNKVLEDEPCKLLDDNSEEVK